MEIERYTWMNSKLEERTSPLGGKGTYALESISQDELLMVFGGYVMSFEEEAALPANAQDLAIQIEQSFVIGRKSPAATGTGDYVNHSCEPNAGIRGQISLYAMRSIEPDEEITFDYGTVLFSPINAVPYELPCACAKAKCRGTVTSNDWMKTEVRESNRKYLPFYITDAIEKLEERSNT